MAAASSPPPLDSLQLAAAESSSAGAMEPLVPSLHSLPISVLQLVLRFVPLRYKLLHLSHVSHSVMPLTPACFSEDSLWAGEPTAAVDMLAHSASLQSLLSQLRLLTLYASCGPHELSGSGPQSEQSARLPLPLEAFSRLHNLRIRLLDRSWYAQDVEAVQHLSALDLQAVLTSLSSQPLLHSLSVDGMLGQRICRFVRVSDLALLSGLHSLRSLTLGPEVVLADGALSLLCSLPLQHLDLRVAWLGLEGHEVVMQPPAVSSTLRQLYLPEAETADAKAEVRRVLAAYGTDRIEHGDAELRPPAVQQLELVCFSNWSDDVDLEMQQLVWRIPSLTALPLTVTRGTSLLQQPASAGLMLPQLRCVSLQIRAPDDDDDGDEPVAEDDVGADAQRRRDWLCEAAADCDGFLRLYSGQLLRLVVSRLPDLPAAAPIVQAAFHCRQLRHLQLDGVKDETGDGFAALSFSQLPHLHKLWLKNVALSTDQLTSLLRGCPALEHFYMQHSRRVYELELLLVIGRSCRRLRELDVDKCRWSPLSPPVLAQLTEAERAAGGVDAVFPRLLALAVSLDMWDAGSGALSPASPETLRWLLRLLHSAPALRFLHLDVELAESELPLFSSLTALRGFRLRKRWEAWQEQFFYSTRCRDFPPFDPNVWRPPHEAERLLELASDFRSEGALFDDETERFAGRTGREAFFAAVNARLARG